MGLEFTTQSPEIDSAFHGQDARDLVETLSREKARWVARQQTPDTLVIRADTVVVLDRAILGKPGRGPGHAGRPVRAGPPGVHRGHPLPGDRILTQAEGTQVTFRPLTGQEIRQYVSTGSPWTRPGPMASRAWGPAGGGRIRGTITT